MKILRSSCSLFNLHGSSEQALRIQPAAVGDVGPSAIPCIIGKLESYPFSSPEHMWAQQAKSGHGEGQHCPWVAKDPIDHLGSRGISRTRGLGGAKHRHYIFLPEVSLSRVVVLDAIRQLMAIMLTKLDASSAIAVHPRPWDLGTSPREARPMQCRSA